MYSDWEKNKDLLRVKISIQDGHSTLWYRKTYGGGWIDISNKNLEWITTMSKADSRNVRYRKEPLSD